ncbi:MAG: hypothetical protein AABZ47_18990 [Planctomycetota bacterium]
MFWLLVLLALSGFAPCVLVPEWQRTQQVGLHEQIQQHRIDHLQKTVDRESRLLQAMHSDPAVISRVAQRDLSLYRDDERAVMVPMSEHRLDHDDAFQPKWLIPPRPIQQVVAWLPEYDYGSLFSDQSTRVPILVMSTTLMALAFALFGRGKPWRQTTSDPDQPPVYLGRG